MTKSCRHIEPCRLMPVGFSSVATQRPWSEKSLHLLPWNLQLILVKARVWSHVLVFPPLPSQMFTLNLKKQCHRPWLVCFEHNRLNTVLTSYFLFLESCQHCFTPEYKQEMKIETWNINPNCLLRSRDQNMLCGFYCIFWGYSSNEFSLHYESLL